jgi:hypothetical protein
VPRAPWKAGYHSGFACPTISAFFPAPQTTSSKAAGGQAQRQRLVEWRLLCGCREYVEELTHPLRFPNPEAYRGTMDLFGDIEDISSESDEDTQPRAPGQSAVSILTNPSRSDCFIES